MSRASDPDRERRTLSRRSFLMGAGGVVAAGGVLGRESGAPQPARAGQDGIESQRGEVELALRINGEEHGLTVEPRTTLLSALRTRLDPPLTGTKQVCDRGECGACTVLLDGEPIYSCLTLALAARGREITTVEGLARDGELSPVQEAMCAHDAMMCGFCTPGFAVSLTATLERKPDADLDEIRAGCAGNLCRCGTYPHVFEAGLEAGRRMRRAR